MAPVAVDAMGGDFAPQNIVEGAELAAESGVEVILVGRSGEIGDTSLEVVEASQVVAMDADPTRSVRTMKDSSIVRAAELVRDGAAAAMVSAGNTGAVLTSATLRMKRLRGVSRPAIATPLPNLATGGSPNILIDAGANIECSPELLEMFARMGAVYARSRFGLARPKVALLANGEEPSKGSALTKAAFKLLSETDWQRAANSEFVGNVEGRDLLGEAADVIVTDGFTGNVALKALEGAASAILQALLRAFDSSDEARKGAKLLMGALAPLYERINPDTVGGAALVGVNGVCIISHGSSSPQAISHAVQTANDLVESNLIQGLVEAL